MSQGMLLASESYFRVEDRFLFWQTREYVAKNDPSTQYAKTNGLEDWAESVTAVIDPTYRSGWNDERKSYVNWALTVGAPPSNAIEKRWAR
jgi:hypothetical protein